MKSRILGHPIKLTRRNALRLVTAGVAGSLLDAFWFEPDYLSITRRDLICMKAPPALDGLRIGLLADFHFRPESDAGLLDKVVASVRKENLDLVALTGDFISGDPNVILPLLDGLGKMSARHGIFAVMGNHDGWAGSRSTFRREFEKAGISFLINQNSLLSLRGETLAVAGTDYVWLGKPDAARTLKGIIQTTPVLALVHEPDYFDTMTSHHEIMLQLSGHTHGGQCRVPLAGYTPCTPKFGKKYIYGEYSSGNSSLFVTRGVGTTGPRARFSCPPELAILTLRASREKREI